LVNFVKKGHYESDKITMEDKIAKNYAEMERDYTTNESMEVKLKFLKKNISDTYTLIKTTERFEERYETYEEKIARALEKDQERFRGLDGDLMNIREVMKTKADNYDLNVLKESCDRFALYDDLKTLHNKCLPPLAIVQDQIIKFKNEHEQMKEMIRKYDENFNIKANKVDFFELREQKLDKELL